VVGAAALAAVAGWLPAADLADLELEDIPPALRDGTQVAREVSGCTWHDGAMWVVDNEDDTHLLVMREPGRFSPRRLPESLAVSDLEGITSDGTYLYLMSGGGLSGKGDVDPRRFSLVRLRATEGRLGDAVRLDMLEWMKRLARELDADVEKARGPDGDKLKVVEDFKSEGLAMDPRGRLLMGLRKPLVKKRSAVVSLSGYREAFDSRDPGRVRPRVVDLLDLDGGGISSIEYDPSSRSMLVLSIPPGTHRTDLWTWDFRALEHRGRLRGHKAEGVARVGRTRHWLLLADDEDLDGTKVGRFGLLLAPR
jgi:hypothetical protein